MIVIIATGKYSGEQNCILMVQYNILFTTIDSVIIDHACIYSNDSVFDRAGCDHRRTLFNINEETFHQ
jgi:hypothetical protein